ncbi:carboxypeptidase-like regulatory domain-containing protein [Maribellus sediminis]|uniref:carboxypeptidase-like regulatory domain-containing protein n=1 Tax=Maribellus sediminis TaxID=2696285 RepID=UPI0014313746|nr:carboxypeptidase-like regulatory domain-containing protein [Maribellus sediminis]
MTINRHPAKPIFLLTCFLLFFLNTSAQNKHTVFGTVTDSTTGQPIAHVEVFISGTTVGCITDNQGNFSLKLPFLPCTLVADHISFDSFVKPLTDGGNLNIKLSPKNIQVSEIKVSGKNKRKQNLNFFYSRFVPNKSNKIEIINDSVLYFERDEMNFFARTNQPLILINHNLGYKIKIIINEFRVQKTLGPKGEQVKLNTVKSYEVTRLTAYYYYESLEASNSKLEQYRKKRLQIYYGSYRHFLKSIYDNDPGIQGYEIKVFAPVPETAFYRIPKLNSPAREYVIYADSLKVYYWSDQKGFPVSQDERSLRHYYSQEVSTIYPTKKSFLIRENGTSPKLSFIIDGPMIADCFANPLPDDYVPELF